MKFNYIDTLFALSYALDCVEQDLLGVTTGHGKRVAYVSCLMGREMGLNIYQLQDLAACSIMHDSALTQLIQKSNTSPTPLPLEAIIRGHCIGGEKNMEHMLSFGGIKGVVLYHHEQADGKGSLKKRLNETPAYARIIHLADQLDSRYDFSTVTEEKLKQMDLFVKQQRDIVFDRASVECFEKAVPHSVLLQLKPEKMDELLHQEFPSTDIECSEEKLIELMSVFARIIDYKSPFTSTHSIGIAKKVACMGEYYRMDRETVAKLYVAGALHDIGKLSVHHDVLEKPDKLTEQEYRHIQSHAYYTYFILSQIKGFEDICSWASLHHEKLDGSGYPFGKTAEELGHKERLMGCVDIYQALTEDRPYRSGMSHEQAIEILRRMANANKLDGSIVEDIDRVFGAPEKKWEDHEIPTIIA